MTEASCDRPTGEGDDSVDGSTPAGPGREVMALESSKCPLAVASPPSHAPFPHPVPRSTNLHPLPCGPGKQTLKIFDGNDAVQRNYFRAITVPRLAKSQEVLVRGTPQPPRRPVPGGLRGPTVAWLRSRPPPPQGGGAAGLLHHGGPSGLPAAGAPSTRSGWRHRGLGKGLEWWDHPGGRQ